MSAIAELARGVVACGFDGERIDEAALPSFGGYVLFARNCRDVAQVRELTDALRARHRNDEAPPLVAVDQEGGRVVRLHGGVEGIPSMMALGAADDLDLTRRLAEQVAFDLRRAGCTMDLVPSLDLALDPRNTVIGTRAFGADPHAVTRVAGAYAAAMEAAGMLTCFKHFPGHGSTETDSHFDLPVVDVPAETLRARDLIPFAVLAPGARAIMGSHVLVRAFDARNPASSSAAIAGDLLRGELGFRGAYLTDCLEMGAIGDSVEHAVAALAAGADLLLVSHRPEIGVAIADAIAAAVEAGTVPFPRLQEAFERVMALRAAANAPLPLDAVAPHPGIGREVARRAIALVRGVPHHNPLASVAVWFGERDGALRHQAPALHELDAPLEPSDEEIAAILAALERLQLRPLVLARRAHLHPSQAAAIARVLERFPDATVVSLLEPFDVALFGAARHVLAAFGDDAVALGGLADVLFGGSLPGGKIPVNVAVA